MELGTFSISLSAKDMAVSRELYARLGFETVAGDGETCTILANQSHVVGLFLWRIRGESADVQPWLGVEQLDDSTDIRELSSTLRVLGIEPSNDTSGETPSGPASFSLTDPDGNVILIDQHV